MSTMRGSPSSLLPACTMTGVLSFGEASSEGGKSEGILIWNGFDAQEPALQLHTIIIMT